VSMARFKLTLATDDGEVLETWTLDTDPQSADADHVVPLAKMGPAALAADINGWVRG
jgi:hypothetical protein